VQRPPLSCACYFDKQGIKASSHIFSSCQKKIVSLGLGFGSGFSEKKILLVTVQKPQYIKFKSIGDHYGQNHVLPPQLVFQLETHCSLSVRPVLRTWS
jgi:hypothetical protein